MEERLEHRFAVSHGGSRFSVSAFAFGQPHSHNATTTYIYHNAKHTNRYPWDDTAKTCRLTTGDVDDSEYLA
jgi:hypothetical protein